jgi:adenine-specific DNA-methyltransferase
MSASSKNPNQLRRVDLIKRPYTWHKGDCLDFLEQLPDESVQLVMTSPPYSIKKEYERDSGLAEAIAFQEEVIAECFRVVSRSGSICWQVGNYVEGEGGERVPWDILLYRVFRHFGLKLRNRIVWHYEHGMHARHFFSGRYETILWFTKSDDYTFNLDAVRVPQKQPTKRFYKGPRKGELSCNPLGKNPGDVWKITNVKHGHPEKIQDGHPCQFPLELVQNIVLACSKPGDIVLDPFGGVATTLACAMMNGRIGIGSEINDKYHRIGADRLKQVERQVRTESAQQSKAKRPRSSDLPL